MRLLFLGGGGGGRILYKGLFAIFIFIPFILSLRIVESMVDDETRVGYPRNFMSYHVTTKRVTDTGI